MKIPMKPQYNGGLLVNSEFNDGLNGWYSFRNDHVNLTTGISKEGNNFIIASNREEPFDSFSQKIELKKDNHYILSGTEQYSAATFRKTITSENYI
ncbi:unnamed protein product, partial [Cuscuta europaea]